MKDKVLLFFVLLLGFIATADAKNFYVSASGNNANNGLTAATAWQTISKVNSSFASILPGDSILFRRGDVFYGVLIVGKSGSSGKPIIFSAYGTGAKPVISGFTDLSSWTSVGNGIYQAAAPAAKSTLNMVTLNNLPQALGRYPNADAADRGYLKYESYSGTASITDNELTSAINWTGAEVAIRKNLWVIDRCKVTSHAGGKISYTNPSGSSDVPHNNYGYFIQNDPRTLDKLGEWYFNNSTKNLQMYFGTASPSSYTIKVSTIDTLFRLSAKNYININNLVFEGANGMAIYIENASNINIEDCDIRNAGQMGIMSQNITNLLVDGCTTNYVLSNAIKCNNVYVNNTTIKNCIVKNTGTLPGMGLNSGHSYKAIIAFVASSATVSYNRVDTTGFVGIEFQGSNILVNNNVVNYFNFVKDDAGGIYTWSVSTDAAPGTVYTNRVIRDNIVMNGIGMPSGPGATSTFVSGIHLDGRSVNITVQNNTIFNIEKSGIHVNNAVGVNIKNNTFFNNYNAMSFQRWSETGVFKNLAIKNNICYTKEKSQRNFFYVNTGLNEPTVTSWDSHIRGLGDIDSNYYNTINPIGFKFEYYLTTGSPVVAVSAQSREGWAASSAHDEDSKKPAKEPVSYKLNSIVGSNKFTNGTFSSNILGITLFGSSVATVWDNTNKINGGSLKLSFTAPVANKLGTLHSKIGAISSSKKYILRFSTYGTTQQGFLNAYLRKSASPYTTLSTTVETKSFGIGRKDHEFLFSAPTTDAAASFVIEIEQNSGTTYVDNIEFYEANATVYNPEDQLRFEYNATNTAKTIALGDSYTGVDGTVYNGSITLQPYTSKILVKDAGTTGSPGVTATATAATVNCYGGTANVTVTATGGTTPYTGTGTFSVAAGTYNYTVTDAAGATSTASVTVTQPSAALVADATAGTSSATVSATGGTAPYTGTGTFTVAAGTYNYTVTDAKGCTATVSVTVAGGGVALKAAASSTVPISCFGSSSSVAVTATGGTAPYTGTGSHTIGAGKGAIKLSFPTSLKTKVTLVYFTIGAVSSSKNYVLRFSTLGTTSAGIVSGYIRMTQNPWATLVAKQTTTFGTSRKDHEFLFTAPQTQSAASFVIEVDQSSGTTYIDNIAFFEAAADGTLKSGNLYALGQIEKKFDDGNLLVKSTNLNHVAEWDTTGKISNTGYFAVKDANNATSVAVVKTTQPAAPLTSTVTAGILSVVGGVVPVTVTASGGTAPYTGTGSFSKGAGTYTYIVTDANGCSVSKVVTISLALGRGVSARSTTVVPDPVSTPASTDVDAVNKALSITAYPNPSTTSFSLMLEGGSNEKVSIAVYSYDGKPVYQTSGNSNSKYTFGNNFLTGMYIVKVVQGTSTQTLKLVKAR